jgi:Protein of unknown function/Domain of unknown function (DUF1835)
LGFAQVEIFQNMESTLHILFDSSAVNSLAVALKTLGRFDRIIALNDDLSFGPINPPETEIRRKWIRDVLGDTSYSLAATEDFWSEALAGSGRRIAWMSRRVAGEYAGFLEWLSRLGESPCEVVDLTEIGAAVAPEDEIGERLKLPPSLSLLTPEQVLKNGLLDRAEVLQWSTLQQYLALWNQLRSEDAPLRVLVGSHLQSAPITYFDSNLLSNATKEWQRVSRLVGITMAQLFEHSIYQTDELVFFARARALVDSGALRINGTVSDIQHADVRLARS